jgi:enterochelin esterase-like enzyme/sugar lactone lactonase YvrE
LLSFGFWTIIYDLPAFDRPPLGASAMKRLSLALLVVLSPSGVLQSAEPSKTPVDPARVVQAGVPQGKITKGVFESSKVYPGTRRDYSVYVPAQYKADEPANLMVFMDGAGYAKPDGAFRVPVVFDNLIHAREMPVTIAVFVNPGTIPAVKQGAKDRSNRSFEYDSMGDRYARFLVEDFLPVALEGLHVSSDPHRRAVCGISSGGICAFTAAWERPDQFGKVMSHIGSFTNIRGGWAYPGLIRKSKEKPKPIRVYLQEGKDDLNNLFGHWPLANTDMAAALRFAGYPHRFVMTEGGHSGQYGGEQLPGALRWLWSTLVDPSARPATTGEWKLHADAVVRDDVPHGKVEPQPKWKSTIFPGTEREWSIYVPAQYDAAKPAALMVFQDGHNYSNVEGRYRAPVVFDNLIARGDMPPTIGVFIDPGHDPATENRYRASNRGYEYDSLGDRYARFLLEEILPEVEKRYNISKDPEMRAICGASSGGISSFTVAWERPDAFRKVLSTIGSFTNLRGGNVYPSLIRKTEPKPIRVYLADTSGDVDNGFGSWPLANQLMASALRYMGYDVHFEWAEGYAHNSDHGGSIFPDALKWLWRKEQHEPVVDTKGDLGGDMTLLKLLVPGEGWQVVSENLGFADAPCTDADGNFYFCDMKAPAVYKVSAGVMGGSGGGRRGGTATKIADEAVSGLEFGPDGLLYGCQGAKSRVISLDPKSGEVKVVAENVTPNDLAVTAEGHIFITETKHGRVTRIDPKTGATERAATDLGKPNGIVLSNDGGTLAVSDAGGENVWTFRVAADGKLDAQMPTMTLRRPIDPNGESKFNEPPPYQTASRGDGSATDRAGRYYVTSAVGVQVFDPTGRQCGVLPKPLEASPLTSCVLAGPNHEYLYVTNGTTVLRRKVKVQ